MNKNRPKSLIFMKVGTHANESFDDIIARKRKEVKDAGRSFWGYGGGTMHPISKVQPFAHHRIDERGEETVLVMETIVSNHFEEAVAKEFSEDGIIWKPIPKGIEVRGSRYALVLDEIKEGDLEVDLGEYRVGYGPSEGKPAPLYLKGRVDKGLFVHTGPPNSEVPSKVIKPTYVGALRRPYGVLLRN